MLLNLIKHALSSLFSRGKRVGGTGVSTPSETTVVELVTPHPAANLLPEPVETDPPDLNSTGVSLIKSYESCKLSSYRDMVGRWTIGWGTTGPDVTSGLVWTQEQADERFVSDLAVHAKYVEDIVLPKFKIHDDQFSALVSFCYNCGPGNLKKLVDGSDTVSSMGERLLLYDKGRVGGELVPIKGLARRRQAEKALFERGVVRK